jgi:hypothetical protein
MATSFVAEVRLPGRKEVGLVQCVDVLLEVGKSLPADWQRPRTLLSE